MSSTEQTAGVPVPPPLIYVAALAVGLVLEAVRPSFDLPRWESWPAGLILIFGGLAVLETFLQAFRQASTPVDVRRPTTALVTDGPYRLTRNPAYVGMTFLYAGIAMLADAPWAFPTLLVAVVVIDRLVIAREERYLERRFGRNYLLYKAQVRRWM